jgi:hypothetical protein
LANDLATFISFFYLGLIFKIGALAVHSFSLSYSASYTFTAIQDHWTLSTAEVRNFSEAVLRPQPLLGYLAGPCFHFHHDFDIGTFQFGGDFAASPSLVNSQS